MDKNKNRMVAYRAKKEDNSKDGTTSSRKQRVMSGPEVKKNIRIEEIGRGICPKEAQYNLNFYIFVNTYVCT